MMKRLVIALALGLAIGAARADTPAPGVVAIKAGTGPSQAGLTGVTGATGLNVYVINPGGASTVLANQGASNGGSSSWYVTGAGGTFPVTGTFWQSVQPVSQSGTWSVLSQQSGSWSVSVSSLPANASVNLTQIAGSAPSASNSLPVETSFGGSLIDPRQIRALSQGTDAVTAYQGGSWAVTANAGTGTFQTNVTNASIPVTQSGAWTTGRTWTLLNTTDSVNAVQSGTWTVQQGGAPWSVSQSGNWNFRTQDGSGNLLTSQVNGSQRALDVGINVAGAQVDPRSIRALTSSDVVTANAGTGTFTVAGTVTANAGVNLNTSALATSGNQTSGAQKTQVVDGSGNVLGPMQTIGSVNYAPVKLASSGTNGTTAPSGTVQVGGLGSDGNLYSFSTDKTSQAQNMVVVPSSAIATYSACFVGLVPPATPTDVFYLTGSATKIVTVISDQLSGTEGTVAMHTYQRIIRTSASSGGTCTTATAVAHDQNDASATAVLNGCTVSPTSLGTSAGIIQADQFVIPATTGVDSSWPQIRTFSAPGQGQAIVLRGTAQSFALNEPVALSGTNSLSYCVTWTEQ